jgi:DNA-binding transcriptional LysR family regulator
MYEWSDLRLFLAVVRAGSTLGAAKSLGLNQTTVSRRMQALEHALGMSLFDRRTRGYRLTEQGSDLVPLANQVEKAAINLKTSADRIGRNLTGVIRLTAAEMVTNRIIIPIATAFQQQHPHIRIEQIAADTLLDIVHGEADVAFRASGRPDDPQLVALRLPDAAWAIYCSANYASKKSAPASIEEIYQHDVLGYDGGLARHSGYKWFIAHADSARIVSHSISIPNMDAVLRSGLGVGALPCFAGDFESDLIRCFNIPKTMHDQFWLVTSERARAAPQVRAFIDFAVPRVRAFRAQLGGLDD